MYSLHMSSLNITSSAKYYVSLKYPLSQWKKDNAELVDKLSDSTFQLRVGSLLVGWMKTLNLLNNKVVFLSKIEKRNIVIIGGELEKALPKDINKVPLLRLPNKIPMIVQPKPYSWDEGTDIVTLGGYLLNDIEYTDDIISHNWRLANKSSISKENVIYDTVNYTSSVAFKINTKVYDFIKKYHKKYNLIIDHDFIHPLSLKEKLRKTEKIQLESFYSKRELEKNIIGLAEIFYRVPKFYMPVRLDYRGRINVISEYLKYQGSELAKALLLFANGEKVQISDQLSINYLKIFGANCFGNKIEKLSFEKRLKWIKDNEENIINFENGILISKAEDKLLFISFCFEYNNYIYSLNNKLPNFTTYLPIQLDASCNGFQHLSMLIGDLSLTRELNLAESTWSNQPKDFYTFVALKVRDFLENELKRTDLEPKVRESYLRLYKLDIAGQRKLVKKTLMTLPYNATARSIIEYIKENFDKIEEDHYVLIEDPNITFKEIDFTSLRVALHIVLYKEFPKLKRLLKYFIKIASISNNLKLPIPWNLPSGFFVQQQFYTKKKTKAKPFLYSKDLLNITTVDKNKFDHRKQTQSLMPNLIHSLDAASLALLIDNFFKENPGANFYSIHDCFAVTCNKIQSLMNLLKIIYYNTNSKDQYLIEFDKEFLSSILRHYGKECYDPETRIIKIEQENIKNKKDTLSWCPRCYS
jgi:DNA-directed RNA polymerase